MRIRPLVTLWTRWRRRCVDDAVVAAWQVGVADWEAERRKILAGLLADDERCRFGGAR
jgi:hypothetical protein